MVREQPELAAPASPSSEALAGLAAFAPNPDAPQHRPAQLRRRFLQLLLILGLASTAAVCVTFWPRREAPAVFSAPPIHLAPLAFRAGAEQNGVALRWNAEATAIQTATHAILLIRDGERQEAVDLKLEALRTGELHYRPLTGDTGFRLTVTDASGHVVAAEAAATLSKPVESEAVEVRVEASTPAAAPASRAAAVSESPTASFVPPSSHPEQPEEVPGPPALAGAGSAVPLAGALPPRQMELPARPAPRPVVPAASPAPPPRKPAQASEPVLVRLVKPVYPEVARRYHVHGTVIVKIVVGANGRVTKADVLSGAPALHQAALDAVRQWTYKPALLDGQPVAFGLRVAVAFLALGQED
jgi:TonB family protein